MRNLIIAASTLCGCSPVQSTVGFVHAVTPAPRAGSGDREVTVTKVAVSGVDETHGRRIPLLWLELELRNAGATPWIVTPDHVALVRGDGELRAEGFSGKPLPVRRDVGDAVVVTAGPSRRVWARFADVRLDQVAVGSTGSISARGVELDLRAGDLPRIAIADPSRADPAWVSHERRVLAVLGTGLGMGAYGKRHGTFSLDLSLDLAGRIGELDVGTVGVLRTGLEVVPATEGGVYLFGGGGIQAGYTARIASLLLRPTLSWVIGKAAHPAGIETWPHELAGELHVGPRRREAYPFSSSDSALTWSFYTRVSATLGDVSTVPEPRGLFFGFGLSVRGGS